MQSLYDVPAPAKLNLFLHIIGRRPDDGYHLLQSVFMLIDWCDTLHFSLRRDGLVTREDLSVALPEDDLIVRAARALQAATGCSLGAHIGVLKRIPAQAGMGGGSSDAATALLALNRLWRLNLNRSILAKIGLSLGADVPFFLCGHNAWVEGIGEKITPLEGQYQLPPAQFVVVKPEAGLDTTQIFSSSTLKRNSKPATIEGFAAKHYDFGCNDLQGVAQTLCPDVKKAIDWLNLQGFCSRMTGSGSAVFAQVSGTGNFDHTPSGWQVKMCRNLMVHPLAGWV